MNNPVNIEKHLTFLEKEGWDKKTVDLLRERADEFCSRPAGGGPLCIKQKELDRLKEEIEAENQNATEEVA